MTELTQGQKILSFVVLWGIIAWMCFSTPITEKRYDSYTPQDSYGGGYEGGS